MPGPDSLLERDPSLQGRFLALIEDGIPRKYAAQACGFSYRTLYGWVRLGLAESASEPYRTFAWRLYETEVELMRKWLKRLQKVRRKKGEPAAIGASDEALQWLLERRFPLAFGKNAEALPEPIDDVEKELDQAQASQGQLEAGGDAGELDGQRWTILKGWFESHDPQLLQLAIETGLAQAAVEAGGGTQT